MERNTRTGNGGNVRTVECGEHKANSYLFDTRVTHSEGTGFSWRKGQKCGFPPDAKVPFRILEEYAI
jgi:hypothetical protein